MIDGNDGGVDVSTDGGETWFAGAAADLAVLPRVRRHARALPRRRRDAGPRHRAGPEQQPRSRRHHARRLARRRRRRGRPRRLRRPTIPTSSTPASTSAIISRYDHRTRQSRNVSAYPENPSGHGAEDMKYRFQWTAPIAVSPHDPKVVYHGGNVLFRTQRRRPDLDVRSARPHAQRQDEAEVVRRPDHRRQHRRRVLRHDLRRSPSRRSRRA